LSRSSFKCYRLALLLDASLHAECPKDEFQRLEMIVFIIFTSWIVLLGRILAVPYCTTPEALISF
jgi:hypothetical protein